MIQNNYELEPHVLTYFEQPTSFILTFPDKIDHIKDECQPNSNNGEIDKNVGNNNSYKEKSGEMRPNKGEINNNLGSNAPKSSDDVDETNLESESPSKNKNQRRKFTHEEDMKLLKIIALHGPNKWDEIASLIPGRTGRQCRDRFHNYLNPSLTNGPWTKDEDKLLEQKVYELGQHWNKIVKFFRGRSENNIKNRWYTYVSKKKQGYFRRKSSFLMRENHKKREYNNRKDRNTNRVANNFIDEKYNLTNNINNIRKNESNDNITSIVFINENNLVKSPSKNQLEVLNQNENQNNENLSESNKKDKKIFFPLLCPPKNSIIWSFDHSMFDFIS